VTGSKRQAWKLRKDRFTQSPQKDTTKVSAWRLSFLFVVTVVAVERVKVQTPDEIFDDASGDVAIGDLDAAVEKYRRCVQLDPDFFDGWHALGMALMKLGRFEEAIEAGKRAVELRPNDQIGWTSLSLFYNRAGNIKEAEAAGTKAKILSWGGKIAEQ
jgi:Flp pilus assembly protein TadD